ncbi:CoB--CoM heterodisulfide reductase iron-sulfur subunit B family protein [bacterium]|nr:CoB--CoM heterodisulfide reductase iron-sulfur subunit B family protein [bacterium]
MKFGYYPGCSLLGSSREYNESIQAIAPRLGWILADIPDWNCCGASAAHNLNHALSLSLPARVLALAEKEGLTEIMVPCAACFNRLTMAYHELSADKALRQQINTIIELDYQAKAHPINFIDVLERSLTADILKDIVPFKHKVACYYGCLMVRPARVLEPERGEDPMGLDRIMAKLGATPIDWAFKVECCGAGLSISRTETVAKLSNRILDDAVSRGAEAIIVACPMCHTNLDMRRKEIERLARRRYGLPVIYITQAIGLALGIEPKKLGLQRHFVPVTFPSADESVEKKVKSESTTSEVPTTASRE